MSSHDQFRVKLEMVRRQMRPCEGMSLNIRVIDVAVSHGSADG
jgi:hypothetical protein